MLVAIIPGTKRGAQGQPVPQSPQKGPTCWYYAARAVREFHGMTYKHDADMADSDGRDTERRVSNIRKRITQFDALATQVEQSRNTPANVQRIVALAAFLRQLPQGLQPPIRERFPQLDDPNNAAFIANVQYRLQLGTFDGAMQQVQESILRSSLGMGNEGDAWVEALGRYGFVPGDIASLVSLGQLEQFLRRFGPGVANGRYSLTNYAMQTTSVTLGGGGQQLTVRAVPDTADAYHPALHAITVCGTAVVGQQPAVRQLVLYVDPNVPGTTFAMDAAVFVARRYMGSRDNLHFLPCGDQDACQHLAGHSISS